MVKNIKSSENGNGRSLKEKLEEKFEDFKGWFWKDSGHERGYKILAAGALALGLFVYGAKNYSNIKESSIRFYNQYTQIQKNYSKIEKDLTNIKKESDELKSYLTKAAEEKRKLEEKARKAAEEKRKLEQMLKTIETEADKATLKAICKSNSLYKVIYNSDKRNFWFVSKAEEKDRIYTLDEVPNNMLMCNARYSLGKELRKIIPHNLFSDDDWEKFKEGKMDFKLEKGMNILYKLYDNKTGEKSMVPIILNENQRNKIIKYFNP